MQIVLSDITVPTAAVSTLCSEYISEFETANTRYVQQTISR